MKFHGHEIGFLLMVVLLLLLLFQSEQVNSFQLSSKLRKSRVGLPVVTEPWTSSSTTTRRSTLNVAPGHRPQLLTSLNAAKKQQGEEVQLKKTLQRKCVHAQQTVLATVFAIATFMGTAELAWANDPILVAESFLSSAPQTSTTTSAATTSTASTIRSGLNARRYWNIMASQEEGANEMRIQANEGLLDYAVGTVNTMYYDNTGGARFTAREFYSRWRTMRDETRQSQSQLQLQSSTSAVTQQQANNNNKGPTPTTAAATTLATRTGTVDNLKWLISTLNDPFSKYLTREELYQELNDNSNGFLGIGALVETPDRGDQFFARGSAPTLATVVPDDNDSIRSLKTILRNNKHNNIKPAASLLSAGGMAQNLPVVTAVVPDSPAERSGITVGDRIVAVGEYSFLGQSREEVSRNFQTRFATGKDYFGTSDVTVAKPVLRTLISTTTTRLDDAQDDALPTSVSATAVTSTVSTHSMTSNREREVVIGYRQTRVRLPAKSVDDEASFAAVSTAPDQDLTLVASSDSDNGMNFGAFPSVLAANAAIAPPPTKGGNSVVHWELLSAQSPQASIFQRSIAWASSSSSGADNTNSDKVKEGSPKVGYIRLTRFSKSSTAGYVEAVEALEKAGATSFIIDVRNNYGGVIQEAMLTASTLIRDSHAVLCYTLNSRGGFGPHDVEEYLVDQRYPGYLMSSESKWVSLNQAQKENPDYFEDGGARWSPPSSYASLHEQTAKRGLHRASYTNVGLRDGSDTAMSISPLWLQQHNTAAASKAANTHNDQLLAQKNLVVLINEGTASAAEVFASSLHDNGRTLAVIGTNSYGKGLIQHTFPMPDGGALRLTVAEYLTPALHHVTVVGNARFDQFTGDQVGGGIKPDLRCASKQGIPSNVGADLCVGMALDVLEEAESEIRIASSSQQAPLKNHHRHQKQQQQHTEEITKRSLLANGNVKKSKSPSIINANSAANTWDALEQKVQASATTNLQSQNDI